MPAKAPYNFIPLPDQVERAVSHPDELPSHNTYGTEAYKRSGHFDVMLTTDSPLFIRGPLPESDAKNGNPEKNRPEFFYVDPETQEPTIPGSSLRGMLRHILEIVSWGKLDRVSDQRLFYRSVDNTALGREYRRRMVSTEDKPKVEFGFLRRESSGWVIQETKMRRVKRELLQGLGEMYDGRAPNKTPKWNFQYRRVWARIPEDHYLVSDISLEARDGQGWRECCLVLTGDVPKKKKEFVFILPAEGADKVEVSDELIERFHDSDQITNWQETAFPKDKPQRSARERDGMLRRDPGDLGDPVFFLRESARVTFFGRAYMFRLPYLKSPKSLIPAHLRQEAVIDYADALFGFVRGNKAGSGEAQARAGRVTVSDARLMRDQGDPFDTPAPITPPILGTPKPTTFQHYLDQRENATRDELKFYDSSGAQVRGHKLYWRQQLDSTASIAVGDRPADSKQYTQLRAVKAGMKFTFRVHFDNLTDYELMLLAWTVTLGADERRHMLGMGKPFGMGLVQLSATLTLVNRQQRYKRLFSESGWELGHDNVLDAGAIARRFEARLTEENQGNSARQIRWKTITVMLRKRQKSAKLSYMSLDEFRGRTPLLDAISIFNE